MPVRFKGQREAQARQCQGRGLRGHRGACGLFILSKMGALEGSEVIRRITGRCTTESCGEARIEASTTGGSA